MGTNHVKKGANRPSAYGKRARASQKDRMLPKRTETASALRERAIEEARRELAEFSEREAARKEERAMAAEFADAYSVASIAEEAGWNASVVIGWLGENRSATLVAERPSERVAITWTLLGGAATTSRAPLHTRDGCNERFADVAAAIDCLKEK